MYKSNGSRVVQHGRAAGSNEKCTAVEQSGFEPRHGNKQNIHRMTISEDEINDDFERFIRHEAMRANITQEELKEILGLI